MSWTQPPAEFVTILNLLQHYHYNGMTITHKGSVVGGTPYFPSETAMFAILHSGELPILIFQQQKQ